MATFNRAELNALSRGLDSTTSGSDSLYDLLVAIRAELDDIRTQYGVVRTLVNELKTDLSAHTHGGVTAGVDTSAAAATISATSAAALAAATFSED